MAKLRLASGSRMQLANAMSEIEASVSREDFALPRLDYSCPRWYASYTSPRHEKHVARQLESQGVQCFLPLYRSSRRWKDRRKVLDLPLFPGYVFVQIALRDRLRVLRVPGIVQLVSFAGLPHALPDEDIAALRNGLLRSARLEPHPFLRKGCRVRVRSGPMSGTEGILIRRKDHFRVVVSIELIQRSVAAEVDECDIEPL